MGVLQFVNAGKDCRTVVIDVDLGGLFAQLSEEFVRGHRDGIRRVVVTIYGDSRVWSVKVDGFGYFPHASGWMTDGQLDKFKVAAWFPTFTEFGFYRVPILRKHRSFVV